MTHAIALWTVYENPSDYPGRFVVRRHVVPGVGHVLVANPPSVPDPEPVAVVDSLEAARAALPSGLANIGRMPADDPVIVEVWI